MITPAFAMMGERKSTGRRLNGEKDELDEDSPRLYLR